MSSSVWTVLAATATSLGAAACGSDEPGSQSRPSEVCAAETRADPYSAGVTFEGTSGVKVSLMDSNPAPPSLGDNTWTFDVEDSAGTAISDATITAKQEMVDHGHGGSKTIRITSLGGGSYQAAPVNFNMSGYWETEFTVTAPNLDSKVVVKICIP
jgi:hypothetical protein